MAVLVLRCVAGDICTDGQANPVTGLTAEDFEIKEDNIPQTVSSFQFVTVTGRSERPSDESLAIRSREHAAAEQKARSRPTSPGR